MILGTLTPTLTAFASPHTFARRVQIDAGMSSFSSFSPTEALVMGPGDFGTLWLEHAPLETVPPGRTWVSATDSFHVISGTQILYTFGGELTEQSPLTPGPGTVYHQVDLNVSSFQAITSSEVVVLGTDGKLWLEFAPFS